MSPGSSRRSISRSASVSSGKQPWTDYTGFDNESVNSLSVPEDQRSDFGTHAPETERSEASSPPLDSNLQSASVEERPHSRAGREASPAVSETGVKEPRQDEAGQNGPRGKMSPTSGEKEKPQKVAGSQASPVGKQDEGAPAGKIRPGPHHLDPTFGGIAFA